MSHSLSFFFNDQATPEIYPLPLPDPLPICLIDPPQTQISRLSPGPGAPHALGLDRISRLPQTGHVGEQHLEAEGVRRAKIGRAHLSTPVTLEPRIPPSA